MLLGELIKGFAITLGDERDANVRVCDLTEDSRTALPGSLFIARSGVKTDGTRYIEQAVEAGAVAVLAQSGTPKPPEAADAAWLTTPDVALAEALLAERFFGEPARKLSIVGVTGTNGKTTISSLVYQLLRASHMPCGLVGTVMVDDGVEIAAAAMTTPPALEVSYSLARMVDAGYRACSMEVSSHSLDQRRVAALSFDVVIFTNLTGDHLDYHGTMENYAAAKAKLFTMIRPSGRAIVNADDPWHERMIRGCSAPVWRCAMAGGAGAAAADCVATPLRMTLEGTEIELRGPWGSIEGAVRLIGSYNVMNVLQAVAAAHALGIARDDIALALHGLTAPAGRLEMVRSGGESQPFAVFVDYAHTDDALEKALAALRPLVDATGGKLRVVFGCGGDRDRTKRPRMARVAVALADDVIITSDNPRTEKPHAIITEILAGVDTEEGTSKVHVDADRRAAIFRAVERAAPGDVVLIAGKGHEDYQLVSDGAGGIRRLDFDDRLVAREALAARSADAMQVSQTEAERP